MDMETKIALSGLVVFVAAGPLAFLIGYGKAYKTGEGSKFWGWVCGICLYGALVSAAGLALSLIW